MTKTWTDFSISSILDLGSCNTNMKSRPEYFTLDAINLKEHSPDDMKNLPSSPDNCSTTSSPPRKKKSRTVFTRQQIHHLENAFDRKKYFTNNERQKLASDLLLSETQVKIWLQNRRNKWKKQLQTESLSPTIASPPSTLPFTSSSYNKMLHQHIPPPSLLPMTSLGTKLPPSKLFTFEKSKNYFFK